MRVSPVRLALALVASLLGFAAYGCAQHVIGAGDGEGGTSSSGDGETSTTVEVGGGSSSVEVGGGSSIGSGGSTTVASGGGSGGTSDPGDVRNLHAAVMLASDVGGPVLFSHKQIAFLISRNELTCDDRDWNLRSDCPFWYLQTNAPLDELAPGRVFPLQNVLMEQSEPWGHDGSCVPASAHPYPVAGTVTIDAVDDQSVSFTVSGTADDWPLGHESSDGSCRAPSLRLLRRHPRRSSRSSRDAVPAWTSPSASPALRPTSARRRAHRGPGSSTPCGRRRPNAPPASRTAHSTGRGSSRRTPG